MDTTTADIALAGVPQDDGSIARALEDADARFEAWSDAMFQAQDSLSEWAARSADRAAEPQSPSAPPETATTEDQAYPLPEREPAGAGETRLDAAAPAEVPEAPGEAEPPAGQADEDEEALMAALDAETAAAVRVMRRITSSGKSVRELIEEYQSAPVSAAGTHPPKRSWWSRGKQ
jgi:hypothetical protein